MKGPSYSQYQEFLSLQMPIASSEGWWVVVGTEHSIGRIYLGNKQQKNTKGNGKPLY